MRFASALRLLLALSTAGCDRLLPSRVPAVAVAPPAVESAPPTPDRPPPPRRPPPADTARPTDSDHFSQIRRALRRLVAAEQGFYAENGTYTEDLDRLGYRGESRTAIRFLSLKRDGWTASATHPALPGRDCVIYVGRVSRAPTTVRYRRSAREGIPACDDVPPARRAEPGPATAVASAPDTTNALDAVNPVIQMRVDLRNLVLSQNAFRAAQGIYSRRVEPLALQYLWRPGVTIRVLGADGDSWTARATHIARPGKSCVVWYGPVGVRPATDVQRKTPDRPGVPVCDE